MALDLRKIPSEKIPIIALAIALLTALFSVDGQSIWSDEACTAIYAIQPTFSDMLTFARNDQGGDPLMPLSIVSVWLWGQIFGTSELALRSLNLIWAVATLSALYLIGKKTSQPWLPLLMAIQPYFWYYTNELRPYAAQIAIGCWLLYVYVDIVTARQISRRAWIIFCTSAFILCFSSVLAPLTLLPIFGLLAAFITINRISIKSAPILVIVSTGILLSILYFYYYETLSRGAAGVKHWPISILNLIYISYEISGAFGLGPPIHSLREAFYRNEAIRIVSTFPASILVLGLYAGAAVGVAVQGAKGFFRSRSQTIALGSFGIFLITLFLFFFLAIASHKAFWGRHMAAAFPFYVFGLGCLLKSAWNITSHRRGTRIVTMVFLILLLGGSLCLRFNPANRKEDIRFASGLAASELSQGHQVLWMAEWRGAAFYKVLGSPLLLTDQFYLDKLNETPPPEMVIFSNRQFFRERQKFAAKLKSLGDYSVEENGIFTIYRRPSKGD